MLKVPRFCSVVSNVSQPRRKVLETTSQPPFSEISALKSSIMSNQSQSRAPGGDIPRCDVEDVVGIQEALRELGVVIISQVASPEELEEGKRLFWDWVESIEDLEIQRDDISTFTTENWKGLGYPKTNVFAHYSIGQSEFLWHARTLPGVRRAFQQVWGVEDLITSFDGCCGVRNPFLHSKPKEWVPEGGWFHLDQNWNVSRGLRTYQGVLNYFEANEHTGSTVVAPHTHHRFQEICCRQGHSTKKNFVKMNKTTDSDAYEGAIQAMLQPGDLFLWDSRVVHCSQGPDISQGEVAVLGEDRVGEQLARLVAYICMVPRSHIEKYSQDPKAITKGRRRMVMEGVTGTHDPLVVISERDGRRAHKHPNFTPPPKESDVWELV